MHNFNLFTMGYMKDKAKKTLIFYENWVSWDLYQIVEIYVDNLMKVHVK